MIWYAIKEEAALAIHHAQIARHGGLAGVRDKGLLASALARANHLQNYGKPDIFDLSAAYGFGIARNHPFVDGNKRTAFVCIELMLQLNGYTLIAGDVSCVSTMQALAAGELSEADLAQWLRDHGLKMVDKAT